MVSRAYVCPRCGYSTTIKCDIARHLNRKKICQPLQEEIPLDEAAKTAVLSQRPSIDSGEPVKMEILAMKQQMKQQMEQQIEHLFQRLIDMLARNGPASVTTDNSQGSHNTTTTITTTTTTENSHNTTNINITLLRPFQSENWTYISDKELRTFNVALDLTKSVMDLVELVHFNPEHPENHSVHYVYQPGTAVDDAAARTWNGQEWIEQKAMEAAQCIKFRILEHMEAHIERGPAALTYSNKEKDRIYDYCSCAAMLSRPTLDVLGVMRQNSRP